MSALPRDWTRYSRSPDAVFTDRVGSDRLDRGWELPLTDDQLDAEAQAQTVTTQHRDRARGAAVVSAAAAAALAAAVFNPTSPDLVMQTRVAATWSAGLLALTSGLLLLASLSGALTVKRARRLWAILAPWLVVKAESAQVDGIEATQAVRRRVQVFTGVSVYLGAVALVSLLLALFASLTVPAPRVAITASFLSTPPVTEDCGTLPLDLHGSVTQASLSSSSDFLLVQVDPRSCPGAKVPPEVLLRKSTLTVTRA